MERVKMSPKSVFINRVDSYASRWIAKRLSGNVVRLETEEEEEEREERSTANHGGARAFHVVGTVSDKSDEDRAYVSEEYLHLNRDELLSKLMDCDVIIYNITQHAEQVEEALWAATVYKAERRLANNPEQATIYNREIHKLEKERYAVKITSEEANSTAGSCEMGRFSGPKMFILVSTVMTWACSKPAHPDSPFTDEMFRIRRAHPSFSQHIDLEKKVVKMGKSNRTLFSTYVVVSGLQYGMGEQVFHFFFKTSWLGQEHEIPVFGNGNNIVPTIHVNDLASVIESVIEHQPEPYYLLAVDSSNNTMEDIVKAVASFLGPGKIQKRPLEEAFLTQDLSGMEIDSLLVNLHMEAALLKKVFSITWLCETGLVNNMQLVVEEYRQARGLLPIRLCVLGPPAVGKTTMSKHICEHYKLHHITLKETITEVISQLEDNVKDADPDADHEAKELLSSLKESMEQNEGLLDDQLLVTVVKDKLMSNPCRNQGFVLDGFPKTYEQARELFYAEEHESEDGASQIWSHSKMILPEFVLCLDASDTFLKDRVMNLPERLVQEHNYEQEHFLRRLARYRKRNMEDETVVNYFHEMDISPLYLEITSSREPDCLLLMQKIFDTVGQPRNYGPSSQEVEEEERRKVEKKMKREAQEKAEEERKEEEEAEHRATRWEEWTKALEEERQQEEALLEAHSRPMRSYLMEHVMPTLTQGLLECCTARPQDPVDFLAEFLMKNNPFSY